MTNPTWHVDPYHPVTRLERTYHRLEDNNGLVILIPLGYRGFTSHAQVVDWVNMFIRQTDDSWLNREVVL